MIALVVSASILGSVGVAYALARRGRWSREGVVPKSQLPTALQRQELDRLAFRHRVRTRAVLDAAIHDIQKAAREYRSDR